MLDGLRAELVTLGLSRFDIQLPGEDSAVAPLEGALRVRAEGGRFILETVDYGEAYRLLAAESEPVIAEAVIGYVSRPLPPVRVMSRHELDTIVGKVALHYFDLRDRARDAGPQGIVIDLPPELPIDRIGALDGVHTYPIDTPFEFRSLPPTALRPENDVHRFLTTADVRVRAVITPPWFGRPGGGIRFTLQQPETGIRDLVVAKQLQRIQLIEAASPKQLRPHSDGKAAPHWGGDS
ncbi:MAG TPA: TNT domain-containing protein [Propionibacteriaceae bacterium]|nr:TNT domain-containing protein [Propionibacteriaceae bacterium]